MDRILDEYITTYLREADELLIEVKYQEGYSLAVDYKLDRVNQCKGAIEVLNKLKEKFKKR